MRVPTCAELGVGAACGIHFYFESCADFVSGSGGTTCTQPCGKVVKRLACEVNLMKNACAPKLLVGSAFVGCF